MAAIQGKLGELWVASGSGTGMTTEACEAAEGTYHYHVTDAAKRYLDPNTAVLVYDDGVLQTSGYRIDGGCHIVFDAAPTTPVTVTADYLTPAEVTLVQNWSLSINGTIYEITSLGDSARTYVGADLPEWSGSFERFYEASSVWAGYAADNTSLILVRLFEDQPSGYVWTGWVVPGSWAQTVPVELETETFDFTGYGNPVYTTDET